MHIKNQNFIFFFLVIFVARISVGIENPKIIVPNANSITQFVSVYYNWSAVFILLKQWLSFNIVIFNIIIFITFFL